MTSVSSRPHWPLHKTCDQCRSRKVRCDGKFEVCSNCDRLGFSCSFKQPSPDTSGNSELSPANPQRCRVRRACVSCHSLKARCNGQSPACQRCQAKGIQCVYVPSKRAASKSVLKIISAVSQVSGRSNVTLGVDQVSQSGPDQISCGQTELQLNVGPNFPHRDMVTKALESHFKYIHPLPKYAFLHKTSIFQEYDAGEAEESLLLAIIGNTTQVKSSSPEEREYGLKCIDRAETLALRNVGRPSISKLQALVLIMRYRSATQCFSDAFMLLATIARSAFALRLNYESVKLCFLAQESRRRLMWTIYMLDTVWSAGLQEFTICPADVIHLQLPCHERDFELGVRRVTAPLIIDMEHGTELSLLAYHIRVMTIRDRILRYTKHAASIPTSDVPETVKSLETELQNFLLSLPESVKFSEENLRLRTFSPWLPRFVMLHIWYHQCHCDLYRLLFPGLRESLPKTTLRQIDKGFVTYCQIQCVENSRALSGILRAMLSLEIETPVMDTDISVCAYQATRIMFHAYHIDAVRFSLTIALVTDIADICRLLLSKLAYTCPMVSSIQADIENLIEHGFSSRSSSRSSSPDQEHHTSSAAQGASSKQILSRHSLVKKSAFVESDKRVTSTATNQQLRLRSLPTKSNTCASPGAPLVSGQPHTASMHTTSITTQNFVDTVPTFGESDPTSLAQMGWEANVPYESAWDQFPWRLEPVNQVQSDWAEFNLEPDYWSQVQPD